MSGTWSGALLGVLRVVVLTVGERDPRVLEGVRALGADTVATDARPSLEASAAAAAAGLRYIPLLSVGDVDRLLFDTEFLRSVRAIPGIAGFQYYAEDVLEGYTSPADQDRAYRVLKALFPEALVLYATRLDLVATDPSYLDGYFRPEDTDRITPYFYPVGTTWLGSFAEDGPWADQLSALLAPVASRTPAGKAILPVLQVFEQAGFPVGPSFPARQLEVYRRFWPDIDDVAAFWWGGGVEGPLTGLSERPDLRTAITRLFLGFVPEPRTRVVPARHQAPR